MISLFSCSSKKYFFFIITFFYVLNIIEFTTIKCNLLLIFPANKNDGPGYFAYYLNQSIMEWKTSNYSKYCNIILYRNISLSNLRIFISKPKNYIWFQSSIFLFSSDINYKKVIYGPNLSPIKYFKFPLNNTHESKWIEIINKIKYYVVHHRRISNHLMNRTNSYFQYKKYLKFPCCIKYEKDSTIIKWDERKIDFLIYLKYVDCNHSIDGEILINSLNSSYKVIVFRYGSYSTNNLINAARNSKVVIYFSFYDTGAIALIEIQRMGVFTVAVQKEFITDQNGLYLPELEFNIDSAISKLKNIIAMKYDSIYIAEYSRQRSDCKKYFNNLITNL